MMKHNTRVHAAGILIAAMLAGGCQKDTGLKKTPPEVKLYGVESARVEYAYTGDVKGTKNLLIANYGMYERDQDEFTVNMDGQTSEVKSLTIRLDSTDYQIDLAKKQGRKTPFALGLLKNFADKLNPQQRENLNAELIQRTMGGKKVGTETILGKTCDIYEIPSGGRLSLWKGIMMRQDIPMGEVRFGIVAKKLETDINPTIEDFAVPPGISFEQPMPQMPPAPPPQNPPQGGGR
ncbi:MAG: hypothetical protein QHI48_05655 [Bacteroidota bacterium]|nr:hypothetical protein [Bacteroidota bacterium]